MSGVEYHSQHQILQEGLRLEHSRQLQKLAEENRATVAEVQAQVVALKEAKQKLLDEFGQRSKEWRSERDALEVTFAPQLQLTNYHGCILVTPPDVENNSLLAQTSFRTA